MAMVGICSFCGAPATETCRLCGKLVCGKCLDRGTGICLHCAEKKEMSLPNKW